jgi:hypothetical protein
MNHAVVYTSLSVYLLEEVERIYAVNGVDKRGYQLDLVGLQGTDKVPFYIGWQLNLFGDKLLGAVLPKKALAGIVGLSEGFHRLVFRHGNEADAAGKLSTKSAQIVGNGHKSND